MSAGPEYGPLRAALAPEYAIQRVLHESTDGAVYLAIDRTLSRPVVIKGVDPAIAGAARTDAFLREARILASLAHPGIPSVHHAGPIDRYLHIVLEHTGEETLEALLRAGPLSADRVIDLGAQILDALAAVHAAGVAHHEVQPRHVLVEQDRYLLDGFGSAGPAETDEAVVGDLRAVGLLLAEAAGEPKGALGQVIQRVLSSDPARHFRSATELRDALLSARRRRLPWRRVAVAATALLLLTGAILVRRNHPTRLFVPKELAVLPLEVEGAQPLDPLGASIAYLVQLDLENVPGLQLTSRSQVDHWWDRLGPDAAAVSGASAARALRVHWAAHGLVVRGPGDALRVRMALYDSTGTRQVLGELRGSARDLAALGDSLALRVVRAVDPRSDALFEPVEGLGRVPLAALKEFLQGEAAFAQDAWSGAQRHYELALAADSTFAMAEWRLTNVKRWRRLPYEGDLRSVYRKHAARLRGPDRELIEALLEPDLERRFALLDSIVAERPADGYARLLQGEELIHRGPLVGRGLEEAVPVMAAAVARDPSLALAHDHLVLAPVRFGSRDSAAAALALRERVGGAVGPEDLDLVPFLHLVYDERFVPWRAWLRWRYIGWRADPRMLAKIEQVARMGTPWLDMPETQVRYSDLLLRAGAHSAQTYGTAHEGKGLAYYALGRPRRALAEIDAAADLLDSPEARLQQAQWRLVPAALGLPAEPVGEWRSRLERLADDSAVGERAAWTLAFSAQSRGDSAEAARWRDRLAPGSALRVLVEAQALALAGDPAAALARADSVRLAFQVTRLPDGFAGAVFHLLRGDWNAALGRRARADAEWLWYEATDVEGWPQGLAQPGEVDAALGVFARLKRARAMLVPGAAAGDSVRGCLYLTRVLELWHHPEPAFTPLIREAETLAEPCRR
jgi:tetratricopeptide (TPR) repeat protein/tRNA A-37 threonylcarbamoyl transferase component Bud32